MADDFAGQIERLKNFIENLRTTKKVNLLTVEIYMCVVIVGLEVMIGILQMTRLKKKLLIIAVLASILTFIEMASDFLPE